ncbi:MAG: DUF58 domain-containing protein [Myxococcales bacterium]
MPARVAGTAAAAAAADAGDSTAPRRFDEAFLRKLEALTLLAKRTQGGGARAQRRSRRVGAGIEFADHREYAPGDDVRALDWNLLARLDRPYVRLREEDEDLTLSVMVDSSASMGSGAPPKLELAVRVAAALAYVGLSGLDRVGVALVGSGAQEVLPPRRAGSGRSMATRIFRMLEDARAVGRTDLTRATREVHARSEGAGTRRLAVLISDMLDPAGSLPVLDALRAARQEVVLVQVTAEADAVLPVDGEVVLQDVETGETRKLTVTEAVRRTQGERYEALLRGVAGVCRKRGVSCFQIPSHVAFDDAVLRILRAGGIFR